MQGKLVSPTLIILFGALSRILPHPANIAPIAAMALFGGAHLNKKYALTVPLLAMLASDFFLGFHNTMPYVYASFILIGLVGLVLRKKISPVNIILASLFSSFLFFVITNFGVWLGGNLYSKDLSGLMQCYVMALPFFRNTILGDLLYTGAFFGAFELAKRIKPQKAVSL